MTFNIIKMTIFCMNIKPLYFPPLSNFPNILFAWLTKAPSGRRDCTGRKMQIMKSSHWDSELWFMSTGPKSDTPALQAAMAGKRQITLILTCFSAVYKTRGNMWMIMSFNLKLAVPVLFHTKQFSAYVASHIFLNHRADGLFQFFPLCADFKKTDSQAFL